MSTIIKCDLDCLECEVEGKSSEELKGFCLVSQFVIEKSRWGDGIEVYMRGIHPHPDATKLGWWPIGIKWEEYDRNDIEHARKVRPMMEVKDTEVQKLIDDLWAMGYRPSSWDGNAGTLKAIQRLLEEQLATKL